MLSTRSTQINSTFERIVKDKNGMFVRVRFIVVEVNGKFQAQIVSAEPVLEKKENIIYLPTFSTPSQVTFLYKPCFVSKLFPIESLEFLMSQPTRAPSFI